MAEYKTSVRATVIWALAGAAIGLLAFFFLTSGQHARMGGVLLLMVPLVAGFSVALVARGFNSVVAAALLSVLCSLVLLIALGKEGVLCAVLAFPIILAGLAAGAAIGLLVRKLLANRAPNQTTSTGILLLIAPLLIVAGRVERPMLEHPRTEAIQTAIEINNSLEHVWLDILSLDSVDAVKPMLMYAGLPVPQRCTMQGEGLALSVPATLTWAISRRRLPHGIRPTTWDSPLTGHTCPVAIGSASRVLNTSSSRRA